MLLLSRAGVEGGVASAETQQPRRPGPGAHAGSPSRCPGRWSLLRARPEGPPAREPGFQRRSIGSHPVLRALGRFAVRVSLVASSLLVTGRSQEGRSLSCVI